MILVRKLLPLGILSIVTLGVILFLNYFNLWIYDISFQLYPIYQGIDPDNVFMYLVLHHIIQAIFYLTLILMASKLLHIKLKDFGFQRTNMRLSIIATLSFIVCWAVIQFSVGYLMYRNGTQFQLGFDMNSRNVTGYFIFEVLLSGTSEELFYRGFVVIVILTTMKKYMKKKLCLYITATIVSLALFMAGHINFELFPFRITYVNFLQQLTVITVTIFYCIIFLKTKSLLGPILTHNLFNGLVTVSNIILYNLTN